MELIEESLLEAHHLLSIQVLNKLDQINQSRNQTLNLLFVYSDRNWDSDCDQTYSCYKVEQKFQAISHDWFLEQIVAQLRWQR